MDASERCQGTDDLLRETDRLRGFIRALCRDQDDREGFLQDATLAALRQPDVRKLRSWLHGVATHLAHRAWRSETRRRRRERAAARPELVRDGVSDLERLERLRELIDAIGALDGRYREVLVRRYFEGCEPSRIAALLGVPLETVRTRLKRGLAMVRELLDRRHGRSRDAWMLPLLAFTTELPRAGAAAGVAVMKGRTVRKPGSRSIARRFPGTEERGCGSPSLASTCCRSRSPNTRPTHRPGFRSAP